MKLDEIFNDVQNTIRLAYIEAAYFTEADEVNEDDDYLSDEAETHVDDSIREFLDSAKVELAFAEENTTLPTIVDFWSYVGHDLWLTRNGHGAGFWDDPEYYGGKDNANLLTQKAQALGETDFYKGDDGLMYFT